MPDTTKKRFPPILFIKIEGAMLTELKSKAYYTIKAVN